MYPQAVEIQENISLAPYTTFGIGGPARHFCAVTSESDLLAALDFAQKYNLPHFVLGGGSNLLVSDECYEGLVLHMQIMGVAAHPQGDFALYDVGAGEDWDGFVYRAVQDNCAGVECLAGIPGTVGGTPVQNVGAYGQDVAETIASVRAYDTEAAAFVELAATDCDFRYRQSLFNTTEIGRYIVTRVRFALRSGGAPQLRYADLQRRFPASGSTPSLPEVYDAVRAIRQTKGMLLVENDPDTCSAGSFFKNPIVEESVVARVASELGIEPNAVPHYPAGEGHVKIPAAWLLEQVGFHKGFAMGSAGISSRHTLALINRGGAMAVDIHALRDEIIHTIVERFGIRLKQEPVELRS
ncbi:MAG TPA: UDP-N-acetylmuramate dehydrogenase [Acidobacteriaceae bacterium]